MKRMNRLLAVLLSLLLCASPLCSALSEGEAALPVETQEASVVASVAPEVPTPEAEPEPEFVPEDVAPDAEPSVPEAGESGSPEGALDGGVVQPEGDPSGEVPSDDAEAPLPGDPEDAAQGEASGDTADGEAAGDDAGVPDAEETEAPGAESDAETPAIDYTRSAAENPDFARGYAQLLGESVGYDGPDADSQPAYRLGEGVVYALERGSGECDRLRAAFDFDGECSAWFDAEQLRPLSPEEAQSFVERRSAQPDVRCLSDYPELPLDAPACEPIEPSGEEAEQPSVPKFPALVVPKTEFTLGVGESCDIGASFDDGQTHAVTYTSDNKNIAKVSNAGKLTGVKAGSTTVTLKSEFDEEITLNVTVSKAPGSVSLSAPRKTLGVNETIQLACTLPKDTASLLTFNSSAPTVATVDADGRVVTFAPGTAKITVKTFNKKSASVTLTVKPAPEAITLSAHELRIGAGGGANLTATLNAGSAGAYSFRVEPDGAEVLSVDPVKGDITALQPGTATVIVETYNHVTDRCEVEVTKAPARVELSIAEATLGVGETISLPEVSLLDEDGNPCAGSFSFTANATYAKIDAAKGTIKATKKVKGNEPLEVTVVAYNSSEEAPVTATFLLHIADAPTKVTLKATRTTVGVGEIIGVGEELGLTATLSPVTAASKLTYASGKESILKTLDAAGRFEAVGTGSTTIAVKTFNSKVTASVKITVKPAPETITLSAHDLYLGAGDKTSLTATLNTGSAGAYHFRVEPEGSEVLSVDPVKGDITALQPGTATVVVETYNHVTDRCEVEVTKTPAKVELSIAEATLGVGESMALPEVSLYDEDGNPCAGSFSFTANATYAKIDVAKGTIKATKKVKQNAPLEVIVTTYNDIAATFTLHIADAPTKVALSAHHTTLGVNETLDLGVKLSPATAASKLTFTSGNEAVLTVSEAGRVTVVGEGKQTSVTVATFNGKKASVKFSVVPEPEAIALPERLALGVGEVYTVVPVLTPAGSGGGIRYWVDDEDVAGVEEVSGKITAKVYGDTTLHVEMYNGVSASCPLAVRNVPEGIALQDANFTLSAGDTRQLLPPVLQGEDVASGKIAYKSSNTKAAKVDANGLVTAVKKGSAKLTVSSYNKTSKAITVTVKDAPKTISFAEAEHRLFIDHEFVPEVVFSNKVPSNYTLVSSDPSVAEITPDGRGVRGISGGVAQITATSYNNKVTKTPLTVTVPFLPDDVWFEPDVLTLGEGDANLLRAVTPEGQGAEMEYRIEDEGVAGFEQVDNETVRLIAVRKGETKIHLRTQNGLEAEATVRVLAAPTALTLAPSVAQRCIEEETLQLRWGYGAPDEGGSVTFASEDEKIATVDERGLVRFVKTGSVRITATSYNGHVAACALTIGTRPTRMFFEQEEYLVALGDCVRIPAGFEGGCESYELSCGDGEIASAEGELVRGLALGTTTLTAVSRSGLQASCALRVVEAPTSIELDATELNLVIGVNSTGTLHATALPGGAGSVRFSTSDPSVATVDAATGEVTAHARGDCVIRAVSYNGCEAECTVHAKLLLEGVKIGIDPGHQKKGDMSKESSSPKGGSSKYKVTYGCSGVSTHIAEYRTTLTIGLKLRDELQRLGAEVVMTREVNDINISNKQRALLMNDAGVDLALRLHCDSADTSSAKGMSMFTRKTCAYSDKQLGDGMTAKKLLNNENKAVNALYSAFVKATGCSKRGKKKTDEYTMNNWSKVPCVLIEMGFMSNSSEDKKLNDATYQKKIVKGLINGICDYMERDRPTEW